MRCLFPLKENLKGEKILATDIFIWYYNYLVIDMFFSKKGSAFSWLIVGLGNPGLQYENTRHNAGFMAMDKLSKMLGSDITRHKFDSEWGEGTIGSQRVLLAKPQTYMNCSGKAVTAIASFYKIPTENIIILHDDMSLDVGRLRLRRKGSDGGQRGMRDIIELMGTDNITRIKIGVGTKPHPDYDAKDWVLGKIPNDKKDDFDAALTRAADAVKEIVLRGVDSAMNKYNG